MLKYRRVLAFLLDGLFISIIVLVLCNNVKLNKSLYEEEGYITAYNEKLDKLTIETSSSTEEVINKYKDTIGIELYNMIKVQGYRYFYFLICVFLYYIVFVFFNDGKTLGCAIFKLKIVNKNDKKANILNLAIRSLFMGSSFVYMIPITSLLYLIIPRVLDYSHAFIPLLMILSLSTFVEIAFYLYFFLNKKNMSIQDYISNTKIIDTKK